jgi:leucyl aminopeptidase
VEIDNTDAEGRLVLCDALTYAGEHAPEIVLDFATLTGAARIALGPDLPALFANDDAAGRASGSPPANAPAIPLWRMPLWRPYLRYLNSTIADLANAGSRMAGRGHRRAVPGALRAAAADVGAPGRVRVERRDRPGRPAGGEALALRAAFEMLKTRYPG